MGRTMKHSIGGLFLSAALCIMACPPAPAQTPSTTRPTTAEAQYDLDIPAQPLNRALRALSEITGLQFTYTADLVREVNSRPISGHLSAQAALALMLEGSGLTHRFVRERVVTLDRAPAATGTRVLGPVRVEGATASAAAGVNGSSDATATENSGSYTSPALSIASKSAQSIKDTPQSVSVVTQQRIRDQNLTDLRSVLDQTTGITLTTTATNSTSFYARGFAITTFQVDGGTALIADTSQGGGETANFYPVINMAMYDHVEVLRGSAGLFNGYGSPGGTVSLSRKRPLDHSQTTLEAAAGSWADYRTLIDLTAPLAFDGRLRGRAVVSYQDKDYFYDIAKSRDTLNYGIAELDVTPSTLLTAGGSVSEKDGVPWLYTLPRHADGSDLHLPRSTCTCFPWNTQRFQTTELFAQVEQRFGENWTSKLNVTRMRQTDHRKGAYAYGSVVAPDEQNETITAYGFDSVSRQNLAELTLSGSFELFGEKHSVLVGANYRTIDNSDTQIGGEIYPYPGPTFNIFQFDPAQFPEPASNPNGPRGLANEQRQTNAYANLALTPLHRLHLNLAVHYTSYSFYDVTDYSAYNSGIQASRGSDQDFSWPPAWSVAYDLRDDLSIYGSYTDIYEKQQNYVDHDLQTIAPITGGNLETGLKYERADGRLNASLGLYRLAQKNFPQFLDFGSYGNTFGEVRPGTFCCYSTYADRSYLSQGVDLEVTGEPLRGLQLSAGYAFNVNELHGASFGAARGETFSSFTPKHMLKAYATYQFPAQGALGRVNLGGGVNAQTRNYVSGQACSSYTVGVNEITGQPTRVCTEYVPFDYTQGQYAIVSLRASYQFRDSWNAALNIGNVFDKRYYQTMGSSSGGNFYGEPRSYALTVRGSF